MGQFKTDKVVISSAGSSYYVDYTTTNAYVEKPFGAPMNTLTATNDSTTDTVSISYDGATLESDLKPGESITLQLRGRTSAYFLGAAGGDKLRIWSW